MPPGPRRKLHRLSGAFVALFVLMHLSHHLTVLAGADTHLSIMRALRTVYRWPPVEGLLLLCVLIQLATGLPLALAAKAPAQRRARWSGIYLLLFLAIHTTAVLAARWAGIETNIYFAAAGMQTWAAAFFYPYYLLAVVAVVVHLGSAATRRLPGARKSVAMRRIAVAGVVSSGLIVAGMARLDIPAAYLQPFATMQSGGTSG